MILAVDCGSTYLKAALFDDGLSRVEQSSVALSYDHREPGRAELDPEALWRAFGAAVGKLARAKEARTVAITSQAQTFGVVDRDGRAIRPLLSWMDRRAQAEADEIRGRLGDVFHRHCGFPVPLPQLQLPKVLWTRRHTGALLTGACVVALPELLAQRLCGLRIVDRNLAAMGGLYSLEQGRWWDEALAAVELHPGNLGELVDVASRRLVDASHDAGFLPERFDLVCAGNDQTAGAYGDLGEGGGTLLTLGTALVAYRYAGLEAGPFHAAGCWGPYPGGGYYELATRDEGCRALDWAAEYLLPGRVLSDLLAAAQKASPCAGWFHPHRMGSAEAWVGGADVGERSRAVLEGIAFSARELLEVSLGENLRRCAEPIRVAGGGCASDTWMQILADTLGRPCIRSAGDPLLGAARMAAGTAGAATAGGRVFEPSPLSVELYDRHYRSWRSATDRG